MPYFSKEQISRAREMDLLTYLRCYEPGELVHVAGSTYSTREHDSLKISNGKWMWWSRGFGGASALDYLVKVRGERFTDAVEKVLGEQRNTARTLTRKDSLTAEKTRHYKLLLPKKAPSDDKVKTYLISRGIAEKIIDHCIRDGVLYESLPYHNCIFLGHDDAGTVRYASFRATCDERIMGDAAGSEKRYSFRIHGTEDRETLHIFESVIDLLSFASMKVYRNENWRGESMLSLGGIYAPVSENSRWKLPVALSDMLGKNREIGTIVMHLDNDHAGRTASAGMKETLRGRYHIRDEPPVYGKDMNDELMIRLSRRRER